MGASASADTLQVRQTTMECTGRSKASGFAVSIAVSLEGVTVPPPRYSVLSGPHAPTTGQARSPAPLRADLASGLAGILYVYTSILREPGGQAQEESAGQHRVLSLLGWSTRAIVFGLQVRSRSL